MKKLTTPRVAQFCATTLLLVAAGCSSGGDDGASPSPNPTSESEPNDLLGQATDLGTIQPSVRRDITGSVAAFGGDQFDTFKMEVGADATVEVVATPRSGGGDVDVWVANSTGRVQSFFESAGAGAAESGTFTATAGETLYLIVVAYDSDAQYDLAVSGT